MLVMPKADDDVSDTARPARTRTNGERRQTDTFARLPNCRFIGLKSVQVVCLYKATAYTNIDFVLKSVLDLFCRVSLSKQIKVRKENSHKNYT